MSGAGALFMAGCAAVLRFLARAPIGFGEVLLDLAARCERRAGRAA